MCADEKNIKKKKSFLESLVGYKTSELQMTDDIMFTSTLTPSREIVLLVAIPFAFYLREMPKKQKWSNNSVQPGLQDAHCQSCTV